MASLLTGSPGAENSVRRAREADLAAIGAVHARSWGGPYAQVLPREVVAALDADQLADAWRTAVTEPPSPAHTVHVALGDGIVAGFAAAAPATDGTDPAGGDETDGSGDADGTEEGDGTDGSGGGVEVVALEVDPLHTRRGHGSRLLAAVADTARAAGATHLLAWVHVDDAGRAEFLRGAGFAEDGARRRRALDDADLDEPADGLGDGARSVWPEVRFVAWLVEE
ncbi:GNAT family N-acetyltransferase [Aquipuribacter sp. SD81]|uniref:GNAT family N-acetyltransferase n=1 Tax=Aquipuribacter sp. SD81 TaxID=3127703 RepID=UPI003017DF4E